MIFFIDFLGLKRIIKSREFSKYIYMHMHRLATRESVKARWRWKDKRGNLMENYERYKTWGDALTSVQLGGDAPGDRIPHLPLGNLTILPSIHCTINYPLTFIYLDCRPSLSSGQCPPSIVPLSWLFLHSSFQIRVPWWDVCSPKSILFELMQLWLPDAASRGKSEMSNTEIYFFLLNDARLISATGFRGD